MKKEEEGVTASDALAVPIIELIERVKNEPKQEMLFFGMKENSLGFIFGPSKSGKTILCENLGLAIAAGEKEFLELPIKARNPKVLFISLEEFYQGRTARNDYQIRPMIRKHGTAWAKNFIVVTERFPRYVNTSEHWGIIDDLISKHKPGLVIIDSLTRLYEGGIEESSVAQKLCKNLRELVGKHSITLACIHHSNKLEDGKLLTMSTMAGSRVIAQEADFILGVNKTESNIRYLKPIAFRYFNDDYDKVTTFEINEDRWLQKTGEEYEYKLFTQNDGRRDDSNKNLLIQLISNYPTGISVAEIEGIIEGKMARATMFENLRKLISDGKLISPEKGVYMVTKPD